MINKALSANEILMSRKVLCNLERVEDNNLESAKKMKC